MLRIDTHQGSEATSLTIAGKLMGPWVAELERCWKTVISSEPAKAIRVNLTAVTFIDSKGRELLVQMRQEGVALGHTKEEAVANARAALEQRLAQSELVVIEVSTPHIANRVNAWLAEFGRFRDDPTFDDFQSEITAARHGSDAGQES